LIAPHPPRHRIEELVAGRDDGELRTHVDACAECTKRVQALEQARASFLRRRDPIQFARVVVARREAASRARPRLPGRWASLALAAAAAVCFLWVRRDAPDAIRLKGGRSLQAFVQRDGRPVALEDGQPLKEGDRLAFTYSLSEARHLLLLSIDDTGAITRYYPVDADHGALAPAARAQLPLGVELDAHRGEERLVALFSREPLDEARAKDALRNALRAAQAQGRGIASMTTLAVPAEQASVWFKKP
jgi:hypothetical protein